MPLGRTLTSRGTPARPRHATSPEAAPHDVTALLLEWRAGDADALQRLLPLVHGELRRLARSYMARERPAHVLQPTALVNEVFLRLVDLQRLDWRDRAHFLAVAARLMRRTLVDIARAEHARKRGGALQRVTFDPEMPVASEAPEELLAVDQALAALTARYERKGHVVELRVFGGLSVEETADLLQVSTQTVVRDWRFAKQWLKRELARTGRPLPG
jgi:RNA polymerase sigma factor (TIGR02999 family)